MYRIYDKKLLEDIKKIVELINNKQWEKAKSQIQIEETKLEELDEMEQ